MRRFTHLFQKHQVIFVFILVGFAFALLDTLVDYFFFNHEGKYIGDLLFSNTHELYMRSIFVILLIIIGFILQKNIDKKRKLESELQETKNLERLVIITSGIAHNFNNLMSLIIGYAGLTLSKISQDEQVRSNLLEIEIAAKTASKLINQMQIFSGKRVYSYYECNIRSLIENLQKTLTNRLTKYQTIIYDIPSSLPLIRVSVEEIKNVITELIINAIDAVEDNGTISITTHISDVSADEISNFTISSNKMTKGKYLVLSIMDNGIGMGKNIISRIFDPFYTTKFKAIGVGLSLAEVKGIVVGHEGAINVITKLGEGTNMQVYLPMRQ